MGAKHTLGPWVAEDLYVMARGYRVATVHVGTSSAMGTEHDGRAESYADARLIAAAPELLEALIACNAALAAQSVGAGLPQEQVNQYMRAADAAIAKAEGKP